MCMVRVSDWRRLRGFQTACVNLRPFELWNYAIKTGSCVGGAWVKISGLRCLVGVRFRWDKTKER